MPLRSCNHGLKIKGRISLAERIHTDKPLLCGTSQGGIGRIALDFKPSVPKKGKQRLKVFGALLQYFVDQQTYLFPMRQGGPISEPCAVIRARLLRLCYDGVSVLYAKHIVQPPQRLAAAPKVPKLAVAAGVDRAENDVIVDMGSVRMRTDDKGVIPVGKRIASSRPRRFASSGVISPGRKACRR